MFFKPKYCCSCGEKIQRAEWGLLTSRRFCDVCAVENKETDWFFRAAAVTCVSLGIYGFGVGLVSNDDPKDRISNKASNGVHSPKVAEPATLVPVARPAPEGHAMTEIEAVAKDQRFPVAALKEQPRPERTASDEPVYYCGARTRKGTPCSRRVKTRTRCWQHVGQPLASEYRQGIEDN